MAKKAHKKKSKKIGPMYQPTREQYIAGGGKMYGPTRRHFRPEAQAGAAIAAKKVADACAKKLSALKREVVAAEKKAQRCASTLRKTRTHSAPKASKKAHKKSKSHGHSEKTVKLADLLGKGKKRHHATKPVKAASLGGKRWSCGGPVRSGCGGSGSRVLKKIR